MRIVVKRIAVALEILARYKTVFFSRSTDIMMGTDIWDHTDRNSVQLLLCGNVFVRAFKTCDGVQVME